MKCELFSDEFKLLWRDNPEKLQSLNSLEIFYNGLKDMAQIEIKKQNAQTDISKINEEIKKVLQNKQTGSSKSEIATTWINYVFNRITLRTQLKVLDSMQLFFYSCNSANTYGCVLSTRSIIENVAAYQYLISNIPCEKDQVIEFEKFKQFSKLLELFGFGSRFNWDMLHFDFKCIRESFESGKYKWNRSRDRRIPEIAKLYQNLDASMTARDKKNKGQIVFLYTVLSDIMHPSAGGDFIYSENMYKKLQFQILPDENFKRLFIFIGFPNVAIIRHFILLCQEIHHYES
jgi:hypothetical protein